MITRILSEEQRRKQNIFTGELQHLLTVLRDEQTTVRYGIKDNGTEIVEVFDKFGNELAHTDATSQKPIATVHSILVMLLY